MKAIGLLQRGVALGLVSVLTVVVLAACGSLPGSGGLSPRSDGSAAPSPAESPHAAGRTAPVAGASATPAASAAPTPRTVSAVIADVDLNRMQAHLKAMTDVESREPRHPGHAKAIAYIVEQYATDPNVTIMDIAPWGIAGVPAVAVAQRYPPSADATYPGNTTFHTVNDTPAVVTNTRLWVKAARLLLAVALELLRG